MITVRQVKAARALLGWSQSDLAVHSGISEPTIARLESLDGELGGRANTAEKIRAALRVRGNRLYFRERWWGWGTTSQKVTKAPGEIATSLLRRTCPYLILSKQLARSPHQFGKVFPIER